MKSSSHALDIIGSENILYKINFLSCIIMCSWFAMPYLQRRMGGMAIILAFIIWVATSDLRWLSSRLSRDIIFLAFLYISFIPLILTGNMRYGAISFRDIILRFSLFFLWIIMNHYYMYYKKDYLLLKVIILWTILLYAIGSIQTYIGLLIHPMAARELATGSISGADRALYGGIGIGGFGFVYSTVFLLISLIYLIKLKGNTLSKFYRLGFILCFIIFFLMIIQASYAISFLIAAAGILLNLIPYRKSYFITITIFLIILILLIPMDLVGQSFINLADIFQFNQMLNRKFTDLGVRLIAGQSEYGLPEGRIDRYIISLIAFLRQPLFGIYGPFGNPSHRVGGHSGWLDFMAFYGLFSTIPLFCIFYFNFKKHLQFFKDSPFFIPFIIIILLLITFGFINPLLYVSDIGFMIFFVIPAIPFIPELDKSKWLVGSR